MMGLGLEILVIVGLTLVNAFFSGAEIAILAVRKTRLRELAEEGHGAAQLALRLREEPERFLATVQIGITVVGATAGAFGGAVLDEPLAAIFVQVGLGGASKKVAFALIVALVSVLTIVIGELVPKSLALRHAERVALWVARPLFVASRVAHPAVWLLTALSNLALRPFRDRTNFTETRISPEELQQLVEEATVAGSVDVETGEIASRAIDLGSLKGFSVMVPATEIAWLRLDATEQSLIRALRERPHARYPVLDDSQEPAGYVVAHEIYAQLLSKALDLRRLLRDIPTFPEDAAAVEILRALQRARSEIGLLVNVGGGLAGLVSIETLAEELFGEIAGENEVARESFAPLGDGSTIVRGDTPLHEINRELGLELPVEPAAPTLGGLVMATVGRLPGAGHQLTLPGDVAAQVHEVSPRRVVLVRLWH